MGKISAVILAAGKGKRMKSPLAKVLRNICGQPVIYYVLKLFSKIKSIGQVIVVTGYQEEIVQREIKSICKANFKQLFSKLEFSHQAKTLGTADALKKALAKVRFQEIVVVCGDNPLLQAKTLAAFIANSRKKNLSCNLLVSFLKGKNQLGRVIFDGKGNPKAILEKSELNKGKLSQEVGEQPVNSGTYYFREKNLPLYLNKISQNKRKKEYYLTDLIEILYKDGKKIGAYLVDDASEIAGINDFFEFQFAQEVIRKRVVQEVSKKGVEVVCPDLTFISEPVKIGKNSIIYPFTCIDKNVIIGSNCLLGPFLHLRSGSRIKQNSQLGNFLEVNRSSIGKKVKAKHFGYIGDAVICENSNIGAGVVFANYDGKKKQQTRVKKGAFIGSNVSLVAPLSVGEAAVVGAGAVVTKDVKRNQVVAGVPASVLKAKRKGKFKS